MTMNVSSHTAGPPLVERMDRLFQEGIARRAEEADRQGRIPPENWKDIIDSGYLRLFHPREVGGLGADGRTQAMAMESLARACGGTYWSATMSTLLGGKLISTYGGPEHHGRLLAPLLSGERLACFAVVERTSGSDAGGYKTLVRRKDGGYVIRGEKARITNAPVADTAVVLSRLQASPGDAEPGWCLAFVDLRQEGVSRFTLQGTGLRAMPWGGLVFEDAHVLEQDVIPVDFKEFAEGMAWGWLFISLSSIAIAESALQASLRHASEQHAFGRPLGHLQGVHAQLAEMRAEVDAARLLAWKAAWHRAGGRSAWELIAMLKAHATEMAVRVTQQAVQIHGSWGLTRDHLIERLSRDAPMNVIGGFASNRLRELVAAPLAGVEPSSYEPFDWLSPAGLARDLGEAPGVSLLRAPAGGLG